MVKSLLLMVKLPRIHNKNHQRFYIPTKNYPTIPHLSPWICLRTPKKLKISPVVVDFQENQPYPAPPPRSRSFCRTARPLGQAHSPAQALDKMFDIAASSGRWGRHFFYWKHEVNQTLIGFIFVFTHPTSSNSNTTSTPFGSIWDL